MGVKGISISAEKALRLPKLLPHCINLVASPPHRKAIRRFDNDLAKTEDCRAKKYQKGRNRGQKKTDDLASPEAGANRAWQASLFDRPKRPKQKEIRSLGNVVQFCDDLRDSYRDFRVSLRPLARAFLSRQNFLQGDARFLCQALRYRGVE